MSKVSQGSSFQVRELRFWTVHGLTLFHVPLVGQLAPSFDNCLAELCDCLMLALINTSRKKNTLQAFTCNLELSNKPQAQTTTTTQAFRNLWVLQALCPKVIDVRLRHSPAFLTFRSESWLERQLG